MINTMMKLYFQKCLKQTLKTLKEVEKIILTYNHNCADGEKIQNIFYKLKEALVTNIVKTQLQKCIRQRIDTFVNKNAYTYIFIQNLIFRFDIQHPATNSFYDDFLMQPTFASLVYCNTKQERLQTKKKGLFEGHNACFPLTAKIKKCLRDKFPFYNSLLTNFKIHRQEFLILS